MGSVPPDDSILICDQIIPVVIPTDATCAIAILSSVVPNIRGLTRLTCSGLTTILVGKNKLPCVHRLALKVSPANEDDDEEVASGAGVMLVLEVPAPQIATRAVGIIIHFVEPRVVRGP